MALRVQGVASPERTAVASDEDASVVEARLADLTSRELVMQRSGRVAGFSLTAQGAEMLDKLLADEGARADEQLRQAYDRFLLLNRRVLELSSQWQVRRDGSIETRNDHTDVSYDHAVIDALVDVHGRAKRCLAQMATCAERFGPYEARLDSCVERLRCGDLTAFTAPLAESYHTVWFELHQDLLLTLGRQRGE
jgi:hypothetical protein